MENKKTYETPEVTLVEFDARDSITASGNQTGSSANCTSPSPC